MTNTAVIGLQWGDEGKGKVIDYLSKDFDYIIRFQGGNNAGHTVKLKGSEPLISHLIPSGILNGKRCIMARGEIIYPQILLEEIYNLTNRNIRVSPEDLYLSERAYLIMPYHIKLDGIEGKQIDTTRRGIGPCLTDKVARKGITVGDLIDSDGKINKKNFKDKLEKILEEKNTILTKIYNQEPLSPEKIIEEYLNHIEEIKEYVTITNTQNLISSEIKSGKDLLFESAQGTLLDIDHGTYPFVTSSNPTIGGIFTGTGVAVKLDEVIGVMKAYTTRVGNGPFPTELKDELGDTMRKRGKEYGATTGRARRCGWIDLVSLSYAIEVNGITDLVINKLDVLDTLDELKICIAYGYKNRKLKNFPTRVRELENCKPLYNHPSIPGWKTSTTGMTKYDQLPNKAQDYIDMIVYFLDRETKLIGTGPEREQIIELNDIMECPLPNLKSRSK